MLIKRIFSALVNRPPPPRGPDDPPEGVSAESFASRHEISDVSVRGLYVFGAALVVSVLLVMLVVRTGLRRVEAWEERHDTARVGREPGATSLVREPVAATATRGPLLQVEPGVDLQNMLRDQAPGLNEYRWADRPAGTVRLPIERAMDLIAERGLPPVSPGKTMLQLQQERARPEARQGDDRGVLSKPAQP